MRGQRETVVTGGGQLVPIGTKKSTQREYRYTSALLCINVIYDNSVADHFAVFYISTSNTKLGPTNVRSFTDKNIATFRSELGRIDFSPVSLTACPNEAYRYSKLMDFNIYNVGFLPIFSFEDGYSY